MRWFTRCWWSYLLERPHYGWAHYGMFSRWRDWWTAIRCRASGHKCGPIWHNPGGLEPNMRCINCGDYIG